MATTQRRRRRILAFKHGKYALVPCCPLSFYLRVWSRQLPGFSPSVLVMSLSRGPSSNGCTSECASETFNRSVFEIILSITGFNEADNDYFNKS